MVYCTCLENRSTARYREFESHLLRTEYRIVTKILFIQGIHNFALTERFIKDVSSGTGLEVITFKKDYGLWDIKKHNELLVDIETYIKEHDERFIILAHSFGGILAYCLSDEAYARVDKIVTFAAPHQVPFSWFKRLLAQLPHRTHVPVPEQISCGFLFDPTVPYFFTKLETALQHKNFVGTHTFVPNRKAFFKKLILGGVQ